MRKCLVIVAVIIAIVAGFMCFKKYNVEDDSEKTTIKIGVTLPLTGDVAYVGKSVQKALELSLRDLKKEKSLKYDYELLFEDDGLDYKTAVTNYQRFVNMYDVKALFSVWTNSSVISSKNNEKVVHMGCSWGYETAEGLYNFNHSTLPKEQIDTLIRELKKHNVKTMGILHNPIRADEKIVTLLKEELDRNGIEVVFVNSFNVDQKDFRISIIKMKEQPVDMVFVLLLDPGMEVYMKQAKELGYNPQYTTFDYFSYNPSLFEGFWYVRDAVGGKEFVDYFVKETGEDVQACVSNFYDALQIVINAFESSPSEDESIPNLDDVVGAILKSDDLGRATGRSYIDDEGNIHATPTVEIIKDGASVLSPRL